MAAVAVEGGMRPSDEEKKKKANAGKREVGVVEMLEFCKSLNVDPVTESEMLWIAEEAFHAPLPMGWTEHTNDQGNTYFHNLATGQSVWQHPMDDLYRKIVEYYREVQRVGGFWTVEDDIADLEEKIRGDLGQWMELFDENGEKYYFNRNTKASRFDDPRNEMYHNLYARIKMVAKMKERLPLLARAPRPEEPTPYELRLQKIREEEQERFSKSVIRLQGFARILKARDRVRIMRAKRELGKGPQPLRGRLALRMTAQATHSGKPELMLGETTPHRRAKAASRIQARIRGLLARRRFRPRQLHQMFLSGQICKIQRLVQRYLKTRRAINEAQNRRLKGLSLIQRIFRGMVGRLYAARVRGERLKFKEMIKGTIRVQTLVRIMIAKGVVQRMRIQRYTSHVAVLRGAVKTFLATKTLVSYLPTDEPIQCVFNFTTDHKAKGLMPFSFNLNQAPTDQYGKLMLYRAKYNDLFQGRGEEALKIIAAEHMQRLVRGHLARKAFERKVQMAQEAALRAIEAAAWLVRARNQAATKLQTRLRGWHIRTTDVLGQRYKLWIEKNKLKISRLQAQIKKHSAQAHMVTAMADFHRSIAATCVQRHWRGFLARRHFESISEQALWPLKSWFQFVPTGPQSVYCSVQFLVNPRFDSEKFFLARGGNHELHEHLNDMQGEVDFCVDSYLESMGLSPKTGLPNEEVEEEEEEGGKKRMSKDLSADDKEMKELATAIGSGVKLTGGDIPAEAPLPEGPGPDAGSEAGSEGKGEDEEGAESPDGEGPEAEGDGEEGPDGEGPAAEAPAPEAEAPVTEELGVQTDPTPRTEALADPEATLDPNGLPLEGAPGTGVDGGPSVDSSMPPGTEPGSSPGDAGFSTDGSPDETGFQGGESACLPPMAPPEEGELEAGRSAADHGFSPPVTPPGFEGRANMMLKQIAAQGDPREPPDPNAPRKHYAGIYKDGKFVKTNAMALHDLSEDERLDVLRDLEEQRRMRVEELVRRQKKHEQKRRKEERQQKKELRGTAQAEAERKGKELKALLKQKEEAHKKEIKMKMENEKVIEKHMGNNADQHGRRMQVADNRRAAHAQGMAMKGPPPPMMSPAPADLRTAQVQSQRILHRHVHHHMHYHSGQEGDVAYQTAPNMGTVLPALADTSGSLPAIRKTHSEASFRAPGGPQQQQQQQMAHSASAGFIDGQMQSGSRSGSGRGGIGTYQFPPAQQPVGAYPGGP